MYLRIEPLSELGRDMKVPASKPETQRAILAATLADGTSIIHNDLRCLETDTMKRACRQLGATLVEDGDALRVDGTGGRFGDDMLVVDAKGSGLVFRTMMALSSMRGVPTILTGDATLRRRVMTPLFDALHTLGASFAYLADETKAPVINWGRALQGGSVTIPGEISSQFITAVLMAAPLAKQPITLRVTPPVLSQSYIAQTLDTLRMAGIRAEAGADFTSYRVAPGRYTRFETRINADFTSLSYLLMACAIFPGAYRLHGLDPETLQGEQLFIDIVQALGVKIAYLPERVMSVDSTGIDFDGQFEFDVSNGPNIIPTLVALSLFVTGRFAITGGSVTRFHKSSRIEAMVEEARKLGADITITRAPGGHVDGFVTRGRARYEGGVTLSSHGDHRNFMSLFVAALRCDKPCNLDGYEDIVCSFPDFIDQFTRLGVRSAATERHYAEANDE